jgi:hypothetical protein
MGLAVAWVMHVDPDRAAMTTRAGLGFLADDRTHDRRGSLLERDDFNLEAFPGQHVSCVLNAQTLNVGHCRALGSAPGGIPHPSMSQGRMLDRNSAIRPDR